MGCVFWGRPSQPHHQALDDGPQNTHYRLIFASAIGNDQGLGTRHKILERTLSSTKRGSRRNLDLGSRQEGQLARMPK